MNIIISRGSWLSGHRPINNKKTDVTDAQLRDLASRCRWSFVDLVRVRQVLIDAPTVPTFNVATLEALSDYACGHAMDLLTACDYYLKRWAEKGAT